jgi:hypothetical protein
MASNVVRKGELRKHPRYPLSGTVRILWEDSEARQVVTRARLVDVSVSGVQLMVENPIPIRTLIYCNEPALSIAGRGSVRYCQFSKGKYRIGIDFAGGTGWPEPAPDEADVAPVI